MSAVKTPILTRKRILLLGTLLLIALAAFMVLRWATYARPPLAEAEAALQDDALVTVLTEPWLTFAPAQGRPTAGFIFYPGGRIDPRGYAPLLRAIAEAGYLVVVPQMPLNMAPFDANAAGEIMANFPEVKEWAIGGHSVGGVTAAQYAKNNPAIGGLVIWAAFPADTADLSDRDLPTAVIYGSLDPRANDDSVLARRHLLPGNTIYTRIEGGGHHQFGSYAITPQEHQAIIDRQDQQQQIIEATLKLLNEVAQAN